MVMTVKSCCTVHFVAREAGKAGFVFHLVLRRLGELRKARILDGLHLVCRDRVVAVVVGRADDDGAGDQHEAEDGEPPHVPDHGEAEDEAGAADKGADEGVLGQGDGRLVTVILCL